ncbi:MAG: riboflavin synthase [bacterium]|nr:riboflavin synthase [bacterium]
MDRTDIGASIACGGTCLTIVDKGAGWFAAEASEETLGRTTLGTWKVGTTVNLERPMRAGDEFGGHIVQGHVDGVGPIAEIEAVVGGSHRVRFAPPAALMPMIAPKGSIAVNGVSLTVNRVGEDWFEVNLIPHTWANTTFHSSAPGDHVNLEVDVLARYAAQILRWSQK